MARLTLVVLLLATGCANRATLVASHSPRPHTRNVRVHLVTPRKLTDAVKTDLAERDVLLAQQAFLSQSPGSAERAAELYRAAASHGSAVAEYNLGVFYEKGLGVAADPSLAEGWYRRAVNNHDPAVRSLASTGLASVTVKSPQVAESSASQAP